MHIRAPNAKKLQSFTSLQFGLKVCASTLLCKKLAISYKPFDLAQGNKNPCARRCVCLKSDFTKSDKSKAESDRTQSMTQN